MCRSFLTSLVKESSPNFDDNGKVVASKGMKVTAPWMILKSSKFQERFFFFNFETKESCWTLPPQLCILPKVNKEQTEVENISSEQSTVNVLPTLILKEIDTNQQAPVAAKVSESTENTIITKSQEASLPIIPNNISNQFRKAWLSASSDSSAEQSFKTIDECDSSDEIQPMLNVIDGLGCGGFAAVVSVEDLSSFNMKTKLNEKYAMKVIQKCQSKRISKRNKQKEQLLNELNIMTKELTPSPFIQQCCHSFEDMSNIYFVLELQEGGDLFYHLLKRSEESGLSGFKESECLILLAELYLAIEHIHSHGIIHRDIKIENIMLNADGHVKLIDFGLAIKVEDEVTPMKPLGSLIYMAPELLRSHTGGRHTDWWAYGILAYELLTGNTPWSSLTDRPLIKHEIENIDIEYPQTISKNIHEFLNLLLQKKPKYRIGYTKDNEIQQNVVFNNINWNEMKSLNTKPAFLPKPDLTSCGNATKETKKYALETYYAMKNSSLNSSFKQHDDGDVNDKTWFLGLDHANNYLM